MEEIAARNVGHNVCFSGEEVLAIIEQSREEVSSAAAEEAMVVMWRSSIPAHFDREVLEGIRATVPLEPETAARVAEARGLLDIEDA